MLDARAQFAEEVTLGGIERTDSDERDARWIDRGQRPRHVVELGAAETQRASGWLTVAEATRLQPSYTNEKAPRSHGGLSQTRSAVATTRCCSGLP